MRSVGSTALLLASLLLLPLLGCSANPSPQTSPAASGQAHPDRAGESWQCGNDLEVRCSKGECAAEAEDGFTPMSVHVDDAGGISVCAYSGCWEGKGTVVRDRMFLVLIGHDLPFSTAPEGTPSTADVAIVVDRTDGVATLKVGAFAHPLLCRSGSTPQ
jgi:hypothetical protein